MVNMNIASPPALLHLEPSSSRALAPGPARHLGELAVRRTVEIPEVAEPLRARIRSVEAPDFATEVMQFWTETYGLDPKHLVVETDNTDAWVIAYYRGERLVGTVALSCPDRHGELSIRKALPQRVPESLRDLTDIVEVSRLCVAEDYRQTSLIKRICEDVHHFLVASQRTQLVIAAPRWLRDRYGYLGFRGTGHLYPIPGMDGESLEIMSSRQFGLGTYGLHCDPVRWNIFLRDITAYLVEAGIIEHAWWQRALVGAFGSFAPLARWVQEHLTR